MNALDAGFASTNKRREESLQQLQPAMSTLQDSARSISIGKAWSEGGGLGDGTENATLNLIREAGTVDLGGVFRHYGLEINPHTKSMLCPFPFHQDGSPSFNYYSNTNSFYCFGCKKSGGPVHFVSLLQGIKRDAAAKLLLGSFEGQEVDPNLFVKSKEREDLYLQFSSLIKSFIQRHKGEEAFAFADKVCYVFDEANRKHTMDTSGLRITIQKLERMLNRYT